MWARLPCVARDLITLLFAAIAGGILGWLQNVA